MYVMCTGASTQRRIGNGSPEAVNNSIKGQWTGFHQRCFFVDTADLVSNITSTFTFPTFPFITVALFLTVATVTC